MSFPFSCDRVMVCGTISVPESLYIFNRVITQKLFETYHVVSSKSTGNSSILHLPYVSCQILSALMIKTKILDIPKVHEG